MLGISTFLRFFQKKNIRENAALVYAILIRFTELSLEKIDFFLFLPFSFSEVPLKNIPQGSLDPHTGQWPACTPDLAASQTSCRPPQH